MPTYDIAFLGHYTKDTIVSKQGIRFVHGGAINYGANIATRIGLNVAVVTRLAHADQEVVTALQREGVDVCVTYTPSSTCLKLEYPTDDPDMRLMSVTGTARLHRCSSEQSYLSYLLTASFIEGKLDCPVMGYVMKCPAK